MNDYAGAVTAIRMANDHAAESIIASLADAACAEARKEIERLNRILNTPEVHQFDAGVPLEAAHQQERWGAAHDAGKNPEDWFWLVGYLAGKALAAMKAGDDEKAKHHCISTAAALRNWHSHIREGSIDAPRRERGEAGSCRNTR